MRFLGAVSSAFRPEGRFRMETVTAETILPRFQPKGWHPKGDVVVLEDRWFDLETLRFEWNVTVMSASGVEVAHLPVSLCTYRELSETFMACGTTFESAIETATGRPYDLGSSRLTLVAVKDHSNSLER